MKKVLGLITLIIMLFVSCNKVNVETKKEPFNNVGSDVLPVLVSGSSIPFMITYWGNLYQTLPVGFDVFANDIIEDGIVDSVEIDSYISVLGYTDLSDFVSDMTLLHASYTSVIASNNIDITMPDWESEVIGMYGDYFNFLNPSVPLSCQSSLNGCLAFNAGMAAAGHMSCWSTSLMPAVLVLCHASMAAYHYVQDVACYNTYNACIR